MQVLPLGKKNLHCKRGEKYLMPALSRMRIFLQKEEKSSAQPSALLHEVCRLEEEPVKTSTLTSQESPEENIKIKEQIHLFSYIQQVVVWGFYKQKLLLIIQPLQ